MSETKRVSCHCGAVELALELPDELPAPMRCNCSLCKRKGAVMIGVPIGNVSVLRGQDKLSLYQWNTRVAEHYFCSICGIYTHHRRRRDPGQYGINTGCIEDFDIRELGEARLVDGASLSVADPA